MMKEKVKIRKVKKEDLKQYLGLVRKSNIEYSNIIGEKIKTNDKQIEKSFDETLSSNKKILLIAKKNKEIFGYLTASFIISDYQRTGYIDYFFVSKKERTKGIGKLLIKEFINYSKKRKIKKIRLAVNLKNKPAIKFYKHLNFKTTSYEMDLNIK